MPPGNRNCYVCNAEYGVFRWKVQCKDCRRLLCDRCIRKARDGTRSGAKLELCPVCFNSRASGIVRPAFFEERSKGPSVETASNSSQQRARSVSLPVNPHQIGRSAGPGGIASTTTSASPKGHAEPNGPHSPHVVPPISPAMLAARSSPPPVASPHSVGGAVTPTLPFQPAAGVGIVPPLAGYAMNGQSVPWTLPPEEPPASSWNDRVDQRGSMSPRGASASPSRANSMVRNSGQDRSPNAVDPSAAMEAMPGETDEEFAARLASLWR